ncbi:MAG: hypothetical protein AAF357_12500 [Verrucomicrobiota bacterium]
MPDSLSPEVSDLFCCPVTRQRLREATTEELAAFDHEFPEGAWITEDLSRAYPIQDSFPILVPDESQLTSTPGADDSQ